MRVFKEEQRFTQSWLIAFICIIAILTTITFTKSFINNKIDFLMYLNMLIVVLIPCALIFIFKLKTRIDETGIHYQFYPIHLKMKPILWKDIKHAEIRTYNTLLEYGGWGLKNGIFFGKKGTVINIKSHTGIQIILNDNKKVLIGTLKKFDADNSISRYLHKN
ncbi:MAG: hypothetical protein B7Z06_11045 [Flavobacteriales bacterium 32-35-8]|nr:MAG: hypothetical protein B7Z06_11045 [Flavobacteriales bacterium 32-35-8]